MIAWQSNFLDIGDRVPDGLEWPLDSGPQDHDYPVGMELWITWLAYQRIDVAIEECDAANNSEYRRLRSRVPRAALEVSRKMIHFISQEVGCSTKFCKMPGSLQIDVFPLARMNEQMLCV